MVKIAQDIKQKIKIGKQSRKEKHNKEILEKNSNRIEKEEAALAPDPGLTGETPKNANSFNIKSRKYISKSAYFLNGPTHGENNTGTCVTIATQLLLSYNNWANDGRIIKENTGETFFYTERENYLNQPYHEFMISTTSDKKDDNILTFYEYLLDYIDPNENGATMQDAYHGISVFLSTHTPMAVQLGIIIDYKNDDEPANVWSIVKNEIDCDRPAILASYVYEFVGDEYSAERHATVAHGYQTIMINGEQLDGFIVHFGWGDGATNVWIDSSWIYGYLTFRTTHVHSDVLVNAANHVLKCEICERRITTENHTYTTFNMLVPNNSELAKDYHIGYCACGYQTQLPHNYYYQSDDAMSHSLICRECKYFYKEAHFNKTGNGCWHCGYNN